MIKGGALIQEIIHLKSLWERNKVNRSESLIVPRVTHTRNAGSLNNSDWAYKVGYAFRDALDIKFEQRTKNKISNMVWTQGPFLNFKFGDLIYSSTGSDYLQVDKSIPMMWDENKQEMQLGLVQFTKYESSNNNWIKQHTKKCTQLDFLELLISGTSQVVNS